MNPLPNLSDWAAADHPFGKNETLALIGDSITHAFPTYGWWMHLEQYLVTRFPFAGTKVLNLSTIGISTAKTLRRFKQEFDAQAYDSALVYLGMNDSLGTRPEELQRDYPALLDKLAQRGKRVIGLIAPPAYDDQSPEELVPAGDSGHNNADLEWIDRLMAQIGADRQLPVARQFEEYRSLQQELLNHQPPLRLMGEDRIHPGPLGAALTFVRVLEALNLPGEVCSVSIAGESVQAQNACIKALERTSDGLRFHCKPLALPYPQIEAAQTAEKLMPFRQLISRQPLRVKGLAPGRYRITMDGIRLCDATERQLAEGIDLGQMDTLWQRQANMTGQWILRLCQNQSELRDLRRAEYYAMGQGAESKEEIRTFIASQIDGTLFPSRYQPIFRNYLGNALDFPERYQTLDTLWQTAYLSALPKPALMEIRGIEE